MSDVQQIRRGQRGYPRSLSDILGGKAPGNIYCMGNTDLLQKPSVGFCGSRRASEQGLAVANDCASQAAELGLNVVSGNAAGVDEVAHYMALASGGTTILVLPEGINNFRIRKSFSSVWDWNRVLVVSQFEPSSVWQAYRAMERNKVIIGLSGAMIVIEAGEKGGTLDAGNATLSMGVPLFVAHYDSLSADAKGNAILINKGGIPLNKLRSTERANMNKVKDSLYKRFINEINPKLI
ncbi:MAG: DNA-processing protein DprA [Pikeienuella sp.]|uniref:DNA-processing protein DprA n=1 Tax=Pikeienuella sp. TaxID=2831957 RepID=UPI00391DA3D7